MSNDIIKLVFRNGTELEIDFTLSPEQQQFLEGLKNWHAQSAKSKIVLGEPRVKMVECGCCKEIVPLQRNGDECPSCGVILDHKI